MTVPFNTIPGNLLVPFFYAEINSGGTPYQTQPRLLLLGQKLAGGSATVNVPYGPVQSETDIIAQAGLGSMLHFMYKIARVNAPFQPIYILPLADPSGAAAAGNIAVQTGATGNTGVGSVRLFGRPITIQIDAADSRANVATKLIAAINAANLPVTALVDGTNNFQVNLTARHIGALFNAQDVSINALSGNIFTAANAVITALTGGTGVPALTTPLANLGDQEYDWIAGPYADATSLNSIKSLLDNTSGRWSPFKQLYGHYTSALFDTLSNCVTLGNSRNDPHVSIMASQRSPTPEWEWAAAIGAQQCLHLSTAPELSRPLQTLVLDGVLPPDDRSKWWAQSDRQALYVDGMAAYKVTVDGSVSIDRCVTTYQVTAAGAPDATFRDVETMAQLMFTTRYIRTAVANRHARQALADDNPFNVAEVTTPRDIRNTLIHAYQDLVALGVAEKPEVFAQFVTVQRNALDANRVDAFLPIDTVNQLRVFAANVTAFLQFQSPSGAVAVQ